MGDDDGVDINQAVAARGGNDLFLGRRDHAVKILDLVFEDFDELDNATVAHVQSTVEFQDSRVAF